MKVLIKPAAQPKSAEFFKFVIPPDPKKSVATATDKAVVIVNPVVKDPEGLVESGPDTEVKVDPVDNARAVE